MRWPGGLPLRLCVPLMSPVPARARRAVSVCHLAALGAFAASSGTPGPVTRAWRCCLFSGQPPRTAAVAPAWTFLPSVCHRLQFPQNALPETPFHPSPARKRRRRVASVASVPQAGPFVTRSPLLVCDFPHCWPRRFPPPSRHCRLAVPLASPALTCPRRLPLPRPWTPESLRSLTPCMLRRRSSAFLLCALRGPRPCPARQGSCRRRHSPRPGVVCRGYKAMGG